MSTLLPLYIYPRQLPAEGVCVSGRLKLQNMRRLAEFLVKPIAFDVQVALEFGRMGKICTITGRLRCELVLVCQRCLQPTPLLVDHEFTLALLNHEKDAKQLPDQYESLLITDDPISVIEIVEDELLLVLPLVPMHAQADCQAQFVNDAEPPGNKSLSADEAIKKPANPFNALKDMKINH